MEARSRSVSTVGAASLVFLGMVLGTAPFGAPTEGPAIEFVPMSQMGDEVGRFYPIDPVPGGLDPIAAAQHGLYQRDMQGRTAMGWVDWARDTYALGSPAPVDAASVATIVPDIARLYRALDLTLTPADALALHAQVAQLPAPLALPFANLVHVVTDAYVAQVPLAEDILARWPAGFQYGENFVTPAERDEMAQRAADIVAAIDAMSVAVASAPTLPGVALLSDPEGLVILGGTTDDTYERGGVIKDPVLLVDVGGNDVYHTTAGGADPTGVITTGVDTSPPTLSGNLLVVSVSADLGGDDRYEYVGAPSAVQGAASIGGIGVLVDTTGNDAYLADITRTNGPFGPTTYFDGTGQGSGFGGFGVLIDGLGNDNYRYSVGSTGGRSVWAFAQGFGALGATGILLDADGVDRYLGVGRGMANAGNGPFQGMYVQGVGFWGGVGISIDLGLDTDKWIGWDNATTVDYYAQAFGAFGGVGIMFDDGGDDWYWAVEIATAANPGINPLLNCAFGTASFGGFGVFLDTGGNDYYYGNTYSQREASTMNEGFGGPGFGVFNAYGLFVDVGGDDQHIMLATGAQGSHVSGRGVILDGMNAYGNYLDLGGSDVYVGPGADGDVWVAGADVNV